MEDRERIRAAIFEIIENQLKANDPPETAQTLKRLMKEGISKSDAKIYIAQCVSVEIFDVMKNSKPFNKERYIKNLKKLPEEPFDE
jgi:hypothetical protein